jgi:hypothetical protein
LNTTTRQVSQLQIPSRIRSLGRALLDQQLWCWGRDITRPGGNLLLEYGFERFRPPEDWSGSSRYTYSPAPGEWVTLWGFGVLYGEDALGGLYLRRRSFSPQLLPEARPEQPVWSPGQLTGLRSPTAGECTAANRLLHCFCVWNARYESWVQRAAAGHRRECVAAWSKAVLPAGEMAGGWRELAEFFEGRE